MQTAPFFLCPQMSGRMRSELSRVSYRALSPSWGQTLMASSEPNYLLITFLTSLNRALSFFRMSLRCVRTETQLSLASEDAVCVCASLEQTKTGLSL